MVCMMKMFISDGLVLCAKTVNLTEFFYQRVRCTVPMWSYVLGTMWSVVQCLLCVDIVERGSYWTCYKSGLKPFLSCPSIHNRQLVSLTHSTGQRYYYLRPGVHNCQLELT